MDFLKDTCYALSKNITSQQLLDIQAYNSANKPSFQNLTKSLFAQCSIDGKWSINRNTGQNVQKLLFFAVFRTEISFTEFLDGHS